MNESMLEALERWFDAKMDSVHTAIPGRILSYDGHSKRTARVEPLVQLRLSTGESVAIPPIDRVPVVFPGSAAASILFPVSKGDGVLLVFSELSIGNWLNSQGTSQVEAEDASQFSLQDCIAIPGLWCSGNTPDAICGEDEIGIGAGGSIVAIKADGSAVRAETAEGASVVLEGGEVVANGGSAGVARQGDSVSTNLSPADITALATSLLATGAFTPSGVVPPGPGTPVSLTGGTISSASTTVKAG